MNGILSPALMVERGATYTFKVQTGFPVYVTSESTGGYVSKPDVEKNVSSNF